MHRLLQKKFYGKAADIALLILFSVIAGVFSGVLVTLYTVCTGYGEKCSVAWYKALIDLPYLIPLLFVALCCAAIMIGTVLRFIPMAKGSGVPQAEGAAVFVHGSCPPFVCSSIPGFGSPVKDFRHFLLDIYCYIIF